MKTRTKEAIRNEFRAMLEEHDSCATSVNSNNNSNASSPVVNCSSQHRHNTSSSSFSPIKQKSFDDEVAGAIAGVEDNESSVADSFGSELKCPLCNLRVSSA